MDTLKERIMVDEVKNTAAAGAEPANKGQGSDSPTDKGREVKAEASADSSTEEVVKDKDGKPLPWNEQPKWKAARQAEKKLTELLKANELEDPDDLVELIQKGKTVKGKLADLNQLDAILEKAATLDKYQAYWASEEEKKKRATEDPEETIKRLEGKLNEKTTKERQREADLQAREEAKQAIQGYDREVKDLITEMEIPKDQSSFVMKLCGVGNPFNDIDITDRKAIKRVVSELDKERKAYDQQVIKEYLKGKDNVVKISSSGSGAEQGKPKQKMDSAKFALNEYMEKMFRGG
jgi:hypothetical protein